MQTAADMRPRTRTIPVVGLVLLAGLAVLALLLARHITPGRIAAACDSDDASCTGTYHLARTVYVAGAIVVAAAIALVLRFARRAPRPFAHATWIAFSVALLTLIAYTFVVFTTADTCG